MCLAIPGLILGIEGEDLTRQGHVAFGGIIKLVNLAYVPEATVGDYVLVHAGFGIATVDAEEAEKTLQDLADLAADPAS